MEKQRLSLIVRLIVSIGCFVMAGLSFLGVGTMDERHGRLMFGLLWMFVGVLSVLRYMMVKDKRPSGSGRGGAGRRDTR